MGKASKWVIRLLLGKKEEKIGIGASPFYQNHIATTPKVKHRWSFSTSSSKDSTNSKLEFPKLDPQIDQTECCFLVQSTSRDVENAAAVKIQSIFRSYLARKALIALRGLVKLQAFVRGHLVRKRTASTLHRMHALMSIQVRARLHRLRNHQLHLHIHSSQEILKVKCLGERLGIVESKNGYSDQSRVERRVDHGNLSFSRQTRVLHYEHSPINYGVPSKIYPARASYSSYDERQDHYSLVPTFMASTQSSKAKTVTSNAKPFRSTSEPRQRPKWIENHKTTSRNEMGARTQLSSSHSQHFRHDSVDPWFFELYGSSTMSS